MAGEVDAVARVVGPAAGVAPGQVVVVADVHQGVPEHEHRRHEGLLRGGGREHRRQGDERERPAADGGHHRSSAPLPASSILQSDDDAGIGIRLEVRIYIRAS